MSRIETDEVKKTAELARLAITEEEAKTFTAQLNAFLTFADQINELDTAGVEPMTHILNMTNVLREDKATKGLPIEDILKNAPDHEDGLIRVPSILE